MKFGNTVVKHRRIILIAALVLLIPSVLGVIATRINYDMLYYLPEDIETVQGQYAENWTPVADKLWQERQDEARQL